MKIARGKSFQCLMSMVFVSLIFVFSGCIAKPILNIKEAAYTRGVIPSSQMGKARKAIIAAGTDLGWIMQLVSSGHIVGTLHIRSHTAVVDIFYDNRTHSIRYKDSVDLKYDGENIHRRYNTWILNLSNAIQRRMAVDLPV